MTAAEVLARFSGSSSICNILQIGRKVGVEISGYNLLVGIQPPRVPNFNPKQLVKQAKEVSKATPDSVYAFILEEDVAVHDFSSPRPLV